MTQWTERYNTHPLWEILQNLGPAIDNAFTREGTDSETLDGLARLKSILTFVGRRLAGADPYLFQPTPRDNLANAFQSVMQEVQQFVADGSAGHITNANSQADTLLTQLAQINVQLTTEDFIAAKEAAESYREGLKKAIKDVNEASSQLLNQINSLESRIAELSTELTAEKTRLSTIATEFQTQFSTAQELRSSTFANDQKQRQDQLTEFQTQFSSAQELRNNTYANDQKERQDRFNSLFAEFSQKLIEQDKESTKQRENIATLHQSEIAELKDKFVTESTKLHEEILERKADVEKLVGVIGNLGVTSGYLNTANDAKKTVRIWQLITVGAMLILIAIAYTTFLPDIKEGFTWPGFAGRVFVTLTVGALAAYAGTQADKYQKIERYNRRLALELEAIGPFIAPLTEDKQADFRIKIGDRSFGQGEGAHSELDAKSPTSVADIILNDPKVRSFIIDIIKATKT
jgi:hypothetical protein